MRHYKYRSKCWLPFTVIEDAVRNNWVNSLAFLVLLKDVHENNTFYNFSVRKVAKQIGVSHTALSKHIKILLEQDLIVFQNGNMTITAAKKVAKRTKTFLVPICTEKKFKTLSNLRASIKATLIVRNIHKQQYVFQEKSEIMQFRDSHIIAKDDIPRYTKLKKKYGLNPEKRILKKTVLSHHGFGKVINRSKETGKRFKKKISQLGLITSKTNIELFSADRVTRRQFYFMELPVGYFLSAAGYIYRSRPCVIDLRLGLRK